MLEVESTSQSDSMVIRSGQNIIEAAKNHVVSISETGIVTAD